MNNVWTSKDISKATKLQVYQTMILSTLLYNSETWTFKTTQQNRLKVFEMSCLRKIEGVTRRDRIRNSIHLRQTTAEPRYLQSDSATTTPTLWSGVQNGSRSLPKAGTGRPCARTERTRETKEEMDRCSQDRLC